MNYRFTSIIVFLFGPDLVLVHWPHFTWFLYGSEFISPLPVIALYKNHAAMLRYIVIFANWNQRPRFNIMATRMGYVGTPEAFTPGSEDWSLYAQRFHHFLLANGITEESQKLHLLLALVGNSTFRLLTNLVAPRQPGELPFKEALTELESHFKPKPVKIAERFRFYKRNQQPGETVSEYVAELRRLATTCEFGTFLNEALCDRLVCGLREEAMQRRLLAEPSLDLEKACELAQGMEAANRNAKEIQAKGSETLPLVVVGGRGLSLLGRNWLKLVKLDWTKLSKIKAKLQIKANSSPKFHLLP